MLENDIYILEYIGIGVDSMVTGCDFIRNEIRNEEEAIKLALANLKELDWKQLREQEKLMEEDIDLHSLFGELQQNIFMHLTTRDTLKTLLDDFENIGWCK